MLTCYEQTIGQRRTLDRDSAALFLALLQLEPPMIKFEESFRLHADMAEFLRKDIYVHDGINFHSRPHRRLVRFSYADPFVSARSRNFIPGSALIAFGKGAGNSPRGSTR